MIMHAATDLVLAASVVLHHELAHAATGHVLGLQLTGFRAGMYSGYCRFEVLGRPLNASSRLALVNLAGPCVTLLSAIMFLRHGYLLAGIWACAGFAATLKPGGDFYNAIGHIIAALDDAGESTCRRIDSALAWLLSVIDVVLLLLKGPRPSAEPRGFGRAAELAVAVRVGRAAPRITLSASAQSAADELRRWRRGGLRELVNRRPIQRRTRSPGRRAYLRQITAD